MGDANGSIPTVQPIYGRPMWGSNAASAAMNSIAFVSQLSITSGTIESYGLKKMIKPVKGCRNVDKTSMKHNDLLPEMKVDAESYDVTADGEKMDIEAATKLPLSKLYNLF
jgi:urease